VALRLDMFAVAQKSGAQSPEKIVFVPGQRRP
jgi:hypothetical protein